MKGSKMEGKKLSNVQIAKSFNAVMMLRKERTIEMPLTMKITNLKKELEALVKTYGEAEKELILKHEGKFNPNGSYSIPEANYEKYYKEKEALDAFEQFVPFLPFNFGNLPINWTPEMYEDLETFLDPAYITKLSQTPKPEAEA
jgi:hypothetical protein